MWRKKPLSSIELRQLRYFLAAAEQGSFRKAGIALAVLESSISRRIRDLEDHLGASLFQHHNGGVLLTLAGRCFLYQTRTAMQHLGEGAKDVGAIGRSENGYIRVGLSSLASDFLCGLLQTYDAERKGVCIDFIDGRPGDHIAAVRLHRLDIAFVAGTAQHAGCETIHLWSEQVFAALPIRNPLAGCPSLTWSDLVGETIIVSEQAPERGIHDFLVQNLHDEGRHPEVHRHNIGRDNLLSLVAIGRGLALTSEATTSTRCLGLIYRPIAGEMLSFSAVWSPKNDNPALRRLLGMARARSRTTGSIEPTRTLPIPPTGEPSKTRDPWP